MTRAVVGLLFLVACSPATPAASPSVPVETATASPTPSDSLDPVSAAAVDHMLEALDELDQLSDAIVDAGNASDNEGVYVGLANLERFATQETGWAEGQPEFLSADVDEIVALYSIRMLSLELSAHIAQEDFFTGDASAAREAGEVAGDLLSMRGRLLVLQP